MRGAISLGKILGINVYIHFTFFLIFLWVGYTSYAKTGNLEHILFDFAVICAVFLSVLIHEYGHALAARRYGIQTRRIVLLPIGGVAQIEHMPEKPAQELFVTIMGPMVNLVIAAITAPIALPAFGETGYDLTTGEGVEAALGTLLNTDFIASVFIYNCALLIFNLIPAFPMDGGRILRALLNIRLGLRTSTFIAARIGQGLAIAFAILGFYGNFWLILLAVFVFAGAEMELRMVTERAAMRGLSVGHAMLRRFTTLLSTDPLKRAAQELLAGSEKDFLVEENSTITGIITRDILIKALTEGTPDQSIGSVMKRDIPQLHLEQPLEEALQIMREHDSNVLPVYENGQFIGVVSLENIAEVLLLQSALAEKPVGVNSGSGSPAS